MAYQLGLDTGGTYTDAVVVNDDLEVIASAKSLTTHNHLIEGLRGAVGDLLKPDIVKQIRLVSLSTTLATNALVEGRGRPVAMVLIGFTEKQMSRAQLAEALAGDPRAFIAGGHDASGCAITDLDLDTCRKFIQDVDQRVDAYAVSGVFAVRNPEHELTIQALITELTGKPVTCGHHLSSGLDAPRRALTALLNARLIPMISGLLSAAEKLISQYEIQAPLMVVKGDGSLINQQVAMQCPVETILSGPAASVVGAQHLCKKPYLVISDIGGTTTDVALISQGQPKLSRDGATVGGWRTMVNAVEVHTYGLGGDSALNFSRDKHAFTIGPQRVLPMSLLVHQYPELLAVLKAQLELPYSTTHSAQFVMVHSQKAVGLSLQQKELYDQIAEKPIAIQTLFSDQTLDRALHKLEQKGMVIRAGFTPTDASHIVGLQNTWNSEAAVLAAQLLMRYSADNLGKAYSSEQEFANMTIELVAQNTALVLLDSVATSSSSEPLSNSQKQLILQAFANDDTQPIRMNCELAVPIVGLGAPAKSYYSKVAKLLNADVTLPDLGHVANALGAVVGTVRQQQVISIVPAGGKRVRVLFPDGPIEYDSLEEGVLVAESTGSELAQKKALNAGAETASITLTRKDNLVKDGDQQVFFESCITAIAVGRPASR